MTELKLTVEEMLRIELHYSEHRCLEKDRDILVKEQELLKNKAQIAQLIKQNAELEVIQKNKQITGFSQTIKNHQDSYENNLKAQIMARLELKPGQNFSYAADTLEVTISGEPNKQTESKKEK